jgi:hypothetical protein
MALPTGPTMRRWFRFSLRALMLAVAICSLPAYYVTSAIRQHRLIEALRQFDATVAFDNVTDSRGAFTLGESQPLGWLARLFGEEYVGNVTSVDLFDATDEQIALVAQLGTVRRLHLASTQPIASQGLAKLPRLKIAELNLMFQEGFDLACLATWMDLEKLEISFWGLESVQGFESLSVLPRLRELVVYNFTDPNIQGIDKLKSLQTVRLEVCPNLSTDALQSISALPNLQHLALKSCPEVAIDQFEPQSGIRRLTVGNCASVTLDQLASVASLPKLQFIAIYQGFLPEELEEVEPQWPFETSKALPNRQGRHVHLSGLPAVDLAELQPISDLTELVIDRCVLLTPLEAPQSRPFQKLTNLTLRSSYWVEVADLRGMERLEVLSIDAPGIVHLEDAPAVSLDRLRKLDLTHDCQVNVSVFRSMPNLNELEPAGFTPNPSGDRLDSPKLRRLRIKCYGFATPTMFVANKNLEDLTLIGPDDMDLESFTQFSRLRSLFLESCSRLTTKGLQSIARLSGLKTLTLQSCDALDDESIRRLAELDSLENLKIVDAGHLTAKGLEKLARLPRLRQLHLIAYAGQFNKPEINGVRRDLPTCRVEHEEAPAGPFGSSGPM